MARPIFTRSDGTNTKRLASFAPHFEIESFESKTREIALFIKRCFMSFVFKSQIWATAVRWDIFQFGWFFRRLKNRVPELCLIRIQKLRRSVLFLEANAHVKHNCYNISIGFVRHIRPTSYDQVFQFQRKTRSHAVSEDWLDKLQLPGVWAS